MFPTTQPPVFSPIPIFNSKKSLFSDLASCSLISLSSFSALCILNAASQETCSCLSTSIGAFQKAIIQSPIYLSIVPFLFMISLVRGVKNLFISFVKPCGSDLKASEIVVNPLTSQKRNVIFFVSPPKTNLSGSSANCSTRAGDRY